MSYTMDFFSFNARIIGRGDGGSVTGTSSGRYHIGELISQIAVPDSGYHFTGWTIDGVFYPGDLNAAMLEFDMPDNRVILIANFEKNEPLNSDPPDNPGGPDKNPDPPDNPNNQDSQLLPGSS